ncbi:MAG: hypothetical protein ACKV2U_33535 [Bryobacteraceae bacterium]
MSKSLAKAGLASNKNFDSLFRKNKNPGRISSRLHVEYVVHVGAVIRIAQALFTEMQAWAVSRKPGQNAQSDKIDAFGWKLAVESLEQCIDVLKVDKTDQIIQVGIVIAEKMVDLFGGAQLKSYLELLKAIKETIDTSGVQGADHRTTAKVLLSVEVLLRSLLFTSQYAVAQVRCSTPGPGLDFDVSLEVAGQKVMNEAKEVVVEAIKSVRLELEATLDPDGQSTDAVKLSDCFPTDGFWPTDLIVNVKHPPS